MTAPPPALPRRWVAVTLAISLAALAAIAIVPSYLSGLWPWVNSPQVAHIDRLHALETDGLPLPGWQLTALESVPINRQTWTLAQYQAQPPGPAPIQQFALLLHPQPWHSNQPQLEWVDLAGAQNWRVELQRRLRVTGPDTGPVTARFLRAWGDRQSLAVVQWYAWPDGGHPAPSHWFWANQWSQLTRRQLTPWVAVCVLLPMEPLGAIADYQPAAETLTQMIQQQLAATVFQKPNSQ